MTEGVTTRKVVQWLARSLALIDSFINGSVSRSRIFIASLIWNRMASIAVIIINAIIPKNKFSPSSPCYTFPKK
jgi:hypothetical protein